MNQREASAFIVGELEKGRSCDHIVRALCEQTGWPAGQVELFVRKVEAGYREQTAQPGPQPPRRAEFTAPREIAQPTPARPPQPAPRRAARPAHKALDQHADATEFVIQELSKHRNQDDIIRVLCERHEWSWPEARHFVQRVAAEHYSEIATRQSPFLILLGLGIVLGGLFLVSYVAYLTWNGQYINLAGLPVPYMENLVYIVTGVGMVIGGIAGIWRTISMMRE